MTPTPRGQRASRPCRPRRLTPCLLLALACLAAGAPRSAADERPGPARKHALLVACTRYPSLEDRLQLDGPGNDAVLMQNVLREKLGFPADAITVLSEKSGGKDRTPTRANIEREFRRLASDAKAGDFVFIHLGGHGSQQPADTTDPDNYEPDGLDETFFPSDIGPWERGKAAVKNAITDNELGAWLRAIRAKGASVWLLVDSCHSGTMARGNEERARRVIPTDLIPKDVFEKARLAAADRAKRQPAPAAPKAPDFVAIYAAQPDESTYEVKLPRDSADQKFHGILTFAVCKALTQAKAPLTYRELTQRVQAEYTAWGRTHPTPLVEGKDQDREVGGVTAWPGRSRFVLAKQGADRWTINAGTLHGVTAGSVLAVFDPAGEVDRRRGHVTVKRCRTLEAEVEPCAHAGAGAPKDLPDGGRCEVVFLDYGDLRFRVAVGATVKKDEAERLTAVLRSLSKKMGERSLVEVVQDPQKADWLLTSEKDRLYLAPASGWAMPDGAADAPMFGPFPRDDRLESTLEDRLARIARARSLLKLAGDPGAEVIRGSTAIDVDVELLRLRDENDPDGKAVAWGAGGVRLADGDIVRFKIKNRGRTEVDATLLFVDNAFGVDPFFPEAGTVTDNRIKPGQFVLTDPRRVRSGKIPGADHVVAIAVEAKGAPVDFSCLAQPSVERARGTERGRAGMASPLGKLLESAVYGGPRGGFERVEADKHAFRLLSWQVSDKPRAGRP